jgi:hypothetical protein
MFPIRSLALIVALTLSTSVPLTAVANAAPAPQAQPQAALCDTDASCAQYAYDHGWSFDEMTPESKVGDRSRAYGWALANDRDRREAARAIADRLDSGQPIFEDWTWVGMPPVVGAFNDALLDEWTAAGRPDASGWLEAYAATEEA